MFPDNSILIELTYIATREDKDSKVSSKVTQGSRRMFGSNFSLRA